MRPIALFFKTLFFDWVVALRDLTKVAKKLLSRGHHRYEGHKKFPSLNRCVPISDPAFVRPDPMIYDQYFLAGLGLAVTWDNPDIQLFLNGSPVSSSLILPGTTYEIVAQVWNNSTDAPVVALPVSFSFLDFGMGGVSVPIGSTEIDLGVKGGQGCPAFAKVPWTTPTSPGHYCIQVLLQPVDDTNFNNNLGQENVNVGIAHSPAVFTFTLRNDTKQAQSYKFAVDAYAIGTPEPCQNNGKGDQIRLRRLVRHRRGTQPVPPGWDVKISPDVPVLAPDQSISITVTATPPSGFVGDQVLNVNAFHSGGLAGGVTLTVQVV
jgi:hypothetical protein